MTPDIAVTIESAAWTEALPDAEQRCGRLAAIALGAVDDLPEGVVELSIVLADDRTVQGLNRDWRGKDAPTNVLSFATLDDEDAPIVPDAPLLLGDVILAFETCAAEAKAQNKPLADHFSHLVVHGVLHLLGFDHENDDEAEEMEALETTLLAALGIADPYAPDGGLGGQDGP
ncbi:Endoribonuclease YbeY [Candidatus Terasakiella magnetica]|nr:Endoribonuclease YbeY [Candidatus Terasakiella magnetica]